MDQVLKDFGVQPILLAAQAVNFVVLLLILNHFLYKPVLKTLQTRKEKIAEGLENAAEIEKQLAKTEEEKQKVLEKAGIEARTIIQEATASGNLIIEEAHLKATQDINLMVSKAEAQISLDRDKLNQEIKEELADMIAAGLKVISGKVLTEKDKKELVQSSLKNLN